MDLEKILTSDNIIISINENLEFLLELIPELKDMIGFEHNHPHHHLDVWNHTLLALSLSCNDFEIRFILLLHDIGKPHCYQDKEIRHFVGHATVSSAISRNILERLKYNDDFINEVCYLIERHDSLLSSKEILLDYNLAYKQYLIQYCDALAHNPEKLEKRIKYLDRTKKLLEKYK